MTARVVLDGIKSRLEPALFHAPYIADGRRVIQANNHPYLRPYLLSNNSMPVIAEFIAAAPTDVARLVAAVEAVLARADRLAKSRHSEDKEIAEDLYAAIGNALKESQ